MSDPHNPDARTIPDGGLAEAMPDWMRATPEWKRPPGTSTGRLLPPPDTTPIDPRTMIDSDDLPRWLRGLGEPAATESPAPEPPLPTPGEVGAHVIESPSPPARVVWTPTPATTPETMPGTGEASRRQRWWTADWVLGVLMIAIVLTIIYVVLVASGAL